MTERFELVPLGRWGTMKQEAIIDADDELRALLSHRRKPRSFLKSVIASKRKKIPKRLNHAIVVRESGKSIGLHTIRVIKHNTATMFVAIYDRDWWGENAVIEVRKSLIPLYQATVGVTQFACDVHSRNFASILNYKKLGFENVGVKYSAAYDEINERPADYFMFSLRDDQLKRKIAEWTGDE
ncbi:MAG: GNAT family protein [Pseudomonadota bacterium]